MLVAGGRSTPTRRAMLSGVPFGVVHSGFGRVASWRLPDSVSGPSSGHCSGGDSLVLVGRACRDQLAITLWLFSCCGLVSGPSRASSLRVTHRLEARTPSGLPGRCSALALLVAGVLADHHDAAVATDHLALVTDLLDARVDLHVSPFWLGSAGLLVPVDDPTPSEVVRRELHHDPVLGEDPDVVLAHLAADVGQDLVTVAQLDPEHRVRESLDDGALDLDHTFFFGHVLTSVSALWSVRLPSTREPPQQGGPLVAVARTSSRAHAHHTHA